MQTNKRRSRPRSGRLAGLLAGAATAIVMASGAQAHHSQSEFDLRSTLEVEGTVTKLEWKSPHARLYVDAKDAKGGVVNWNFELPSPNTLMRRGWTRDSLKTGDVVKVNASPARNFPAIAIANAITDAEGNALFTGTTQIYEPAAQPPASH
jgi:hypothetical protein